MYDKASFDNANYPPPGSLDAALEREAILEGWAFKTTFPENKQLYEDLRQQFNGSKCTDCC